MQSPSTQVQTWDGAGSAAPPPNAPGSNLEYLHGVTQPSAKDPFLSEVNLGDGYYTKREYWQQVQSFRDGLYAEAAFARLIFDRAVYETKVALATEAWNELEEDGRDEWAERNAFIRAKMDACWTDLKTVPEAERPDLNHQQREQLGARRQQRALENYAGLTGEWMSPHWRMLMARHEASRSIMGRLLDNVFGRIREMISKDDSEQDTSSRLGL